MLRLEATESNAVLLARSEDAVAKERTGVLLQIEIMSRAELEHCPRWQHLYAHERKDRRYYEIVEDSIDQGFDYGYFVCMFAEQLATYLPNFPFSPTEAKFIGAPIDFLVFKGMDAQSIEEVIFVEVKSGSARLSHNEHSLRDAIENKRVRCREYHVPAPLTHTPDTAIEPAL